MATRRSLMLGGAAVLSLTTVAVALADISMSTPGQAVLIEPLADARVVAPGEIDAAAAPAVREDDAPTFDAVIIEPLDGEDAPAAAGSPPAEATPEPVRVVAPATPSDLAGLRFWSSGDSTSFFMSVWFTAWMTQRGAIATQPEPEYKVSTGLLSPARFDWHVYLASEMASRDPDVVVFMIGANDAHAGMPLDAYAERVGAIMDLLHRTGRRVLWVGQPNMGRPDLAAAVPMMNDVFRSEAAARPWVTYVDAWAATSDADGDYAQYLPDENGIQQLVRADDGVHFTSEGGRRLAVELLRALETMP